MLQKTVNKKLAFGVPGSFYDNTPRRVDSKIVEGGKIGLAYTIDTTNPSKAKLGGKDGVFGGIAVNTKEYIVNGIDASLEFRDGDNAQLCTMGRIVLSLKGAVTVGQVAFYNDTTGEITSGTAGETKAGFTEIKGSKFVEVNALANETCVLQLG